MPTNPAPKTAVTATNQLKSQRSRHLRLTKRSVEGIPFPRSGQLYFWDTRLSGFGLRVGAKTKTYFAEARIRGTPKRRTVGKHGKWTAEEAREEAREMLQMMSKGIDPWDLRAEKQARGVTLSTVFEEYLAARALKPSTVFDYRRAMNEGFKDWLDKPVTQITKDMVSKRHARLGERGKTRADLSMRVLRAMLNFAGARYEDQQGHSILPENPVRRLSQTRSWFGPKKRSNIIQSHQMRDWLTAVLGLANDHTSQSRETFRDYLLLMLFSGLRRNEAAKLQWKDIDFKAKTLIARDTKNGLDHVLPMPDFIFSLLKRRATTQEGPFVFPGAGARGYVVEPRKQIERIVRDSGVTFTIHDLRRTFITIASSLRLGPWTVKRLANHRVDSDVTGGYVHLDIEELRAPMQEISDRILTLAGLREGATVIAMKPRRRTSQAA